MEEKIRLTCLLFLGFIVFLFYSQTSLAVAPSIISFPSSAVSIDIPFTITATTSGLGANTTYRFRIALAMPGTSNYFGSTYNGAGWYDGLPSPIDYSQYLTVQTDNNGSWAGEVLGEVQTSDTNFPGLSGTYDLKIGRYTATGTSATWSNIVSLTIIAPTPSPSLIPTNSPTATSVPAPTNTQKQTNPTTKIYYFPTSQAKISSETLSPTKWASLSGVLGIASSDASMTASFSAGQKQIVNAVNEKRFPFFLLGGSIIILSACGIFGIQWYKKYKAPQGE